jgi:hypothetical protein
VLWVRGDEAAYSGNDKVSSRLSGMI